MKKSTIILLVSLILIGLFAGEIQEIVGAWSWPSSPPPPEPPPQCRDTDGGKNYYVKGKIYGTTFTDTCISVIGGIELREYYCADYSHFTYIQFTCPSRYECKDGACICIDTTWTPPDSAASYYCEGETFTQTSNCGNKRTATGTKTCESYQTCQDGQCICIDETWSPDIDPSTVCQGETFDQTSNCENTQTVPGTKTCEYGCREGACLPECIGTDAFGVNYIKAGTTTYHGVDYLDTCPITRQLQEFYCLTSSSGVTELGIKYIRCDSLLEQGIYPSITQGICLDGACI